MERSILILYWKEKARTEINFWMEVAIFNLYLLQQSLAVIATKFLLTISVSNALICYDHDFIIY